jgi:dTMP kinase
MKIAALEGPSFAGKTSTLSALRSLLSSRGLITYRCYVDEIKNADDIPPARTRNADEQLEAFKVFMDIEAQRVEDLANRPDGADLVLLDRSVDTLLAHAYALDQMFGYGVLERARLLLEDLPYLRPGQTFYLDAGVSELGKRRRSTPVFDDFLLGREFVGYFRSYFTQEALVVSKSVRTIDAQQPTSIVALSIAEALAQT